MIYPHYILHIHTYGVTLNQEHALRSFHKEMHINWITKCAICFDEICVDGDVPMVSGAPGLPLAGSSPRQRGRAHTTADLTMQGAPLPAGAKQLQLVGG